MTCIAVANVGNALVFAGDGASTRDIETGALGHNNTPKLFPLIHLHAVCAFAGLGLFGIQYHALVITRGYDDFDDLADNMVEDARYAHKMALRDTARAIRKMGDETCLVVGGWSKRDQAFRVFHLVTYEKDRIGLDGEPLKLKPFTKTPLDYASWASTGADTATLAEFDVGVEFAPDDGDINKWIRYLGRMICANRWACGTPDERGKAVGIGGMVQFCALDIMSIQTWIAHRWPEDEPGQPIDVSKGERLPEIFKVDYAPAT